MKSIDNLGGRALTADELRRVETETGVTIPFQLASLMTSFPLVGLTFHLDEEVDESGLGAEFRWMSVEEMIDEATRVYPGLVATSQGFLPIGICLEGTGDPYFLRVSDGAVVRIPHDAAIGDNLDIARIELVTSSVMSLVENAALTAAS